MTRAVALIWRDATIRASASAGVAQALYMPFPYGSFRSEKLPKLTREILAAAESTEHFAKRRRQWMASLNVAEMPKPRTTDRYGRVGVA